MIMDKVTLTPPPPTFAFNTGTMFDLQVGEFIQGRDGKYYLNGGLSTGIPAVHGVNGSNKSTFLTSLIALVLCHYHKIEGCVLDTELSLIRDPNRIGRFGGHFPPEHFMNRLLLVDCTQMTTADVFRKIKEICALREENKKDLMIEYPIDDLATGRPLKGLLPTIIMIDSFSELKSDAELNLIEEEGLDGSKVKTVFMVDGGIKTIMIRSLVNMCAKYGIIVACTAHWGGTISIDPKNPPMKQMQFMKVGYSLKNVGSKFEFLASPVLQTASLKLLVDDKKECWYPKGKNTFDSDLFEVSVIVQRCKTKTGGMTVPYVISQHNGLLNDVTNYHFLRENKMFGLIGNDQKHANVFLPDLILTRRNIRELTETNPELRRALEITAHLLFLQQYWNTNSNLPFDLNITPEELVKRLKELPNFKMDEFLKTTCVWSPDRKDNKNYLSIFDILLMTAKK